VNNDHRENDEDSIRRDLIEDESGLIASLSQPESKDYDKKYNHLHRDLRMSWLSGGDEEFMNIALPLLRQTEEIFGARNSFASNIKHDIFATENISVGREGKGLQALITRRMVSKSIKKQVGNFSKRNNMEESEEG
jgi:hypothetical protein